MALRDTISRDKVPFRLVAYETKAGRKQSLLLAYATEAGRKQSLLLAYATEEVNLSENFQGDGHRRSGAEIS